MQPYPQQPPLNFIKKEPIYGMQPYPQQPQLRGPSQKYRGTNQQPYPQQQQQFRRAQPRQEAPQYYPQRQINRQFKPPFNQRLQNKVSGNFNYPQQIEQPNVLLNRQSSSNRNSKIPQFFKQQMIKTSTNRTEQAPISFKNYTKFVGNLVGNTIKCQLCQTSYDHLEILCKCSHQFCLPCLTQFIKYKISINEEIHCPSQGCFQPLDEESQFFKHLPSPVIQKYRANKVWRQNIDNPNVRMCPRQGCHQGLVNLTLSPPKCQKCGKTFCVNCQMQAHSGGCEDNFQNNFKEWKKCPQCHIFIEKTEGCNHMTCRCSHQFCFVCLQDWENSHYSCGQDAMLYGQQDHQSCVPENQCLRKISFLFAVLGFPILLFLGLALSVIVLGLAAVIGAIVGPCAFLMAVGNSGGSGAAEALLVCLPLAAVGGVIFMVGYTIVTFLFPFWRAYIRRYCRWMGQLLD